MPQCLSLGVPDKTAMPLERAGIASRPPSSATPLGVAAQVAVAGLKVHAARIDKLPDELAQRVSDARRCGLSWELIGWSLGMAGETARHRWGFGTDSLLSAQ